MKQIPFPDLLETVTRDTVRACSHYPLVTGFFFKVMNQVELVNHYRWLLPDLFLAVTGGIVMTLGRLFEFTDDRRTASLVTFLRRVESHHAADADVRSYLKERRAIFISSIDSWLSEIQAANKRIIVARNADLAHNDFTKVGKSDITWTEIREYIDLAEGVLKDYLHAFEGVDQRVVVVNVESELEGFLEWCRLDDYNRHRDNERNARRTRLEEWAERKRAGDPSVPCRPPL
jgi:hypothetical protein